MLFVEKSLKKLKSYRNLERNQQEWGTYTNMSKKKLCNFDHLSAIQCSGTCVWKEVLRGWKTDCKNVCLYIEHISLCCISLSTARSIQIKDRRAGGYEGGHPLTHGSVNYHAFFDLLTILNGKFIDQSQDRRWGTTATSKCLLCWDEPTRWWDTHVSDGADDIIMM